MKFQSYSPYIQSSLRTKTNQNMNTIAISLFLLIMFITPNSSNAFTFTTTSKSLLALHNSATPHSLSLSLLKETKRFTTQKYPLKSTTVALQMTEEGGNEDDIKGDDQMSFDDATQSIIEQEDEERKEAGFGFEDEEEKKAFNSNQGTYNDMRAQIRSRADGLDMQKSVTTAEAIKKATQRAMSREDETKVDLSKIGQDLMEEEEEEKQITDERRSEIDPIGQRNLLEQALEEFNNTRLPPASDTLKLAGLMIVIFAITATLILKVDEVLRITYTDFGFIPRSTDVLDYSDLELPDGFTDMMNEDDLANL